MFNYYADALTKTKRLVNCDLVVTKNFVSLAYLNQKV